MAERLAALLAHRRQQHVSSDKGVAIAVTADPGARPQERRQFSVRPAGQGGGEMVFQLVVEMRQFVQESGVIEGQRIGYFIHH